MREGVRTLGGTTVSVCGGSFFETCQHIDVEKMYTPASRAELFVFVVRVNKLIIIINYINDDVEELLCSLK